MSFVENVSAVEAILFAYGEPVPVDMLSEASGIDRPSLDKIITLLNDRYDEMNSALQVLKLGSAYQLATRLEYAPAVKNVFETGRNAVLSTAAMESLAIVAYNQPVTRSFVDTVRGVDSSAVMQKLVDRGLIEEAERLDVPGRPIAYRTTQNFLRCFSLSSLENLPPLRELQSDQLTIPEAAGEDENEENGQG
ncbi:MAG: SMC-Scp complex subunit ScpB [Oscillospiraceae bacterium]|nr:SMC-Scp complex subunit ScpB [Oscillospiraceae bacterium]